MTILTLTEVELTPKWLRYYQWWKMLTKKQAKRYREGIDTVMQDQLESALQKAIESGSLFK